MTDEAMTVEQAVAMFDEAAPVAAEPEDKTPAPAEAGAQDAQPADGEGGDQTEAQPSADDADDPSQVIEGEAEDDDDAAQPVIAMPKSWAAEDAEIWESLTRSGQEKVLARETERDQAVNRALTEAAETRREADVEAQKAVAIHNSLTETLPLATRVFNGKWAGWTPEYQAQLSAENPDQFKALKAQYDAEQGQLAKFGQIHKEAEAIAFAEFVRTEQAKLPEVAPELADEVEGPARRKALATFLTNAGFTNETIKRADANMLSLAYDAMKYRQGKTAISTPKNPPPARTVKPAAAPARTPKTEAQDARSRFQKTGSIEDLVHLFDAGG